MPEKLNPDSELPEAMQELVKTLDSVMASTSHREPIYLFAEAFAKYLRTPD